MSNAMLTRHQFTVEQYDRMVEAGVLGPDDRVELIEGEIVEMSPIGRLHAAYVQRWDRIFQNRLGGRALVRVQSSVRLGRRSEPEPDIALLRPRPDDYASGHPGPGDVLLIVEVADTSEAGDREIKIPLYAAAGIPEAWLWNVETRTLTVCREPAADGYRSKKGFRAGDSVSPAAFPDVVISLDELLKDIP